MKVSELQGEELDRLIAKIEDRETAIRSSGLVARFLECGPTDWQHYSPSTDWTLGGPIIERERGGFYPERQIGEEVLWFARMGREASRYQCYGPTPLIAAMRAYVASKYGEEVPDANS